MAIADFELQDAIVSDDASATAAIPLQTRAGILEALELRHTGGSRQFVDERAYSTHPEHWWGVAQAIPIEPYAAQVRVIVRMTVDDASVDVRARVGVLTSTVTRVAAGVTASVALVVTLPVSREPRVEVLSVEWRSLRGDLVTATAEITMVGLGHATISSSAIGSVSGATHLVAVPATDEENFSGDVGLFDGMGSLYIGFATPTTTAGVYFWPEAIPGPAAQAYGSVLVDVYEVGRFTPHGIAWSVEGVRGDPLPRADAFAIGAYMRASDILAMHAVAAQAYDARPWIWSHSSRAYDATRGSTGAAVGDESQCLWSYRPDAVAIEVAGLVDAPYGAVTGRAVTMQIFEADGTLIDGVTIATVDIPTRERRTGPSRPGTLWASTRYTSWGGGDLLYAGPSPPDWQRLTMVRATIPLSALTSLVEQSEPYILKIVTNAGSGSGRLRMHSLTVWERTRSSDSP